MQYLYVPSSKELQKQQMKMNEELKMYGFYLCEEEIEQLMQVIATTCERYELVETKPTILFSFISTFCDTNYDKANTFVRTIKNVIHVYYALRKIYPVIVSDVDLLDVMKEAYLQNHGEMNDLTRRMAMKKLAKEIAK